MEPVECRSIRRLQSYLLVSATVRSYKNRLHEGWILKLYLFSDDLVYGDFLVSATQLKY